MPDVTDDGVPLAHYLENHPETAVRFHCRGCARAFDVPVAVVVAGLTARGDGDETTGVRAVGRLTRRPCARCGGRAFETTPTFRPLPGAGA